MRVTNVWVLTSEYEPEIYTEEREALEATFEEVANNDIRAMQQWFNALPLDEKRALVKKMTLYSETIALTQIFPQ